MQKRVLIYGGKGALGSQCVQYFKSKNWWVGSIDLHENEEADTNIVVDKDADFVAQEQAVLTNIGKALNEDKLDAILCVAGGWAGGNASKELAKSADLMWKQSVWSSVIAASVASHHLSDTGCLCLTGAKAALEPTPSMIGYGMAKQAVHHLVKSLAAPGSGISAEAMTVAILPVVLDTPMNRKMMPNSNRNNWTPLQFVAELFFNWSVGNDRPENGSLVQLITKGSETQAVVHK